MPPAIKPNRDRGEGAIPYVAVILVLAMITTAAVVSGVGEVVSAHVCKAVGEVTPAECKDPPLAPIAQSPGGGGAVPGNPDKDDYFRDLCVELGLDCDNWDPRRGLSCNDHNIVPVYEYYARLSREHPELQWAGMAKLAGGLVYAGMQDLHVLRKLSGEARREFLRRLFAGVPPQLANLLISTLADISETELDYFEDKFVSMQKQIFVDMGWQHAAYVRGGIQEMRRLADEGQLPAGMLDAWEDIASGDPERIKRGNEQLLYREQRIILQDDYDEMKNHHGMVGLAVTYMLSLTAQSPVPGGRSFPEVVHTRISTPEQICVPFTGWCQDIPSVGVNIPTENIADFDDRWKWITEDMLPRYQDLLENEPGRIRREIDRSLRDRAEDYRLIPIGYNPRDGVC